MTNSLADLFRFTWLRYFKVRHVRQYSRAWIADDGALVLKIKGGS